MALRRRQGGSSGRLAVETLADGPPSPGAGRRSTQPQDSTTYGLKSPKSPNELKKQGFWDSISPRGSHEPKKQGIWGTITGRTNLLDAAGMAHKFDDYRDDEAAVSNSSRDSSFLPFQGNRRNENSAPQTISSGTQLGEKVQTTFDEARSSIGSTTIIDPKKIQIRRKSDNLDVQIQAPNSTPPQNHTGAQLTSSRNIAAAMSAKAKNLLRELKAIKGELVLAKLRCNQLEEENKNLQNAHLKGNYSNGKDESEDLMRLQLEFLLAEKARLMLENSAYARENQLLHEALKYHQLTESNEVSAEEEDEFEAMEMLHSSYADYDPEELPPILSDPRNPITGSFEPFVSRPENTPIIGAN